MQRKGRRLNEQFINDINDDMMAETIGDLTTVKKTNEVTSQQVLAWTRRVEAQRARNNNQGKKRLLRFQCHEKRTKEQ